jgi:SAM-dependent methyltransferase
MTPRERVANFDHIARPYRWMEYLTFGRALERCRNRFLPQFADRRNALVMGDGDGRFLAVLLAANPELRADAVDTSAAMLRLLQRRADAVDSGGRLRTHQISALEFEPGHSYDLVATHFFLDCLTQAELDRLCSRIALHVQARALWVISDFRIPTDGMRWPARSLVRLLYLGFRLLTGLRTATLPDHAAALSAAGFGRIAWHESLKGLLTSEIWEYTPSMQLPPQRPKTPHPPDPVPDPEPASPSLPEPDPGVFHPDPGSRAPENSHPIKA